MSSIYVNIRNEGAENVASFFKNLENVRKHNLEECHGFKIPSDEDASEAEDSRSSNCNQNCSTTSGLERKLWGIIIFLLTFGIIIIVYLANTGGNSGNLSNQSVFESRDVCLSPECITTAAGFLQSMDFKQNPCDDFYSFVCGNWIKNTYLAKDISVDQFNKLESIIILRIKELLESNSGTSNHEIKTKKFYQACMNLGTRDETKSKVLLEDLARFGGWPMLNSNWTASNFSWSDLMVQFYRNGYPIDMLLNIDVRMDMKNTSTSLIQIRPPTLIMHKISGYKEVIREVARLLNPDLDEDGVADEVDAAFDLGFQLDLATILNFNGSIESIYNIMTLKEIEVFAPEIPWRYLLTHLLSPGTFLQDDQRMMVTVPGTLEDLDDILANHNTRVLANYMIYRAVLFAVEHLEQELFFMYENTLHASFHRDLWQMCVTTVMDFFHMSVTTTYAKLYTDNRTRSNLQMMFQDLKASLIDEIEEAKWLDEETRKRALLKVRKAQSALAYRDEIFDENKLNDYYSSIEVGDDHFTNVKSANIFKFKSKMVGLNNQRTRFRWSDMDSVLIANAFYYPNENSITIPIGLLEDPFFSSGRPNYINYGSLGAIIGHECTHAFDRTGSLYDEDGNYRMWWTDNSWENYKEKTDCYVQQYDKYYESQVHAFVRGAKTLSENIADNGGLNIAYKAYQKMRRRVNNEKQLPGLPFSESQMFWVAFASAWCEKESDKDLNNAIQHDEHCPGNFRVNGALANMREFAEDFKCEEGSALNPRSKCSLWI